VTSILPVWCHWAWFLIAAVGFPIGALCWILFVFWPYIRWSKQYMIDARAESERQMIELRRELSVRMGDVRDELNHSGHRLEHALVSLADAQKVQIAVQVLCTVVPIFLREIFELDRADAQGNLFKK
jgi:hypothetical protein